MKYKNDMARRIQKGYSNFKKVKIAKRVMIGLKKIIHNYSVLQKLWRVRVEYKKFQNIKKSIRKIQRWYHKKYMKKLSKKYRHACISIQSYFRRVSAIEVYEIQLEKVLMIQRVIKGGIERIRFRKYKAMRKIVLV